MKKWPDNDSTVPFQELVESIIPVIEYYYQLERKTPTKSINYVGYDIGSRVKVTSLSPDKALQLEQLQYDLEEQGRDALVVIISIAVQLGIEQGIRIEKEQSRIYELTSKHYEKLYNDLYNKVLDQFLDKLSEL